ncbi:hypothetical protein LXL04_000079 [Taraxacum kok-saghyz]
MVWLNRRLLLTDNSLNVDDADDSSHSDETNFDADMVVMLAALLCALVAALLLNSVVHLYLRRRRESMEAAANLQAGSGLEKRAIKKIPVTRFRMRRGGSATECSICLGDFVNGERVRVLPECSHEFHVKCVDKWLNEHASCPNCRRSLGPAKGGDDGGDRAMVRAEQGGM